MATDNFDPGLDNRLVDLVRANPMLYERGIRSTPYESIKKKTEIWRSIAMSLGVDTRYCIIHWRNLRDRFHRELTKLRELQRKSDGGSVSSWALFDKMQFLESHMKGYSAHSKEVQAGVAVNLYVMDTEDLIEEDDVDDPLQEAMEEQHIKIDADAALPRGNPNNNSNNAKNELNMKRIEVLLSSLDEDNRIKAEKRIVAYLCKCQLKALNNADVSDVSI